jgi:flavin reductase (DIM6/NTAB) family NADH-FMN oxidoreductase RutF
LISATKEYVINLPTTKILEQVDRCGTVSGRTCPDKFRAFGLTPVPSVKVRPPCIEECPVNIECEVLEVTRVGDHDLFLGKAVAMRVDADKLDERGEILAGALNPIVYITGEYWSIGERLGTLYFTARDK